MSEFVSANAAIVASSKVFWNVEPDPFSSTEPEPDLLLLPQAASSVARPTTATSTRVRIKVAFTGYSSGDGGTCCARLGPCERKNKRWIEVHVHMDRT